MKPSTKEAFLFLGGGVLVFVAFALGMVNVIPEAIAGVIISIGLILAIVGCVVVIRRQTTPWSRPPRRSRARGETQSMSM